MRCRSSETPFSLKLAKSLSSKLKGSTPNSMHTCTDRGEFKKVRDAGLVCETAFFHFKDDVGDDGTSKTEGRHTGSFRCSRVTVGEAFPTPYRASVRVFVAGVIGSERDRICDL